MKSIAMEFDAKEKRFIRREISVPALEAGELLVEVLCCTICGSDLHSVSGRRECPDRCVLGHEIVGRIKAWNCEQTPIDFHGNDLQVGQRVTWTMAVGCGDCFYCENNLWQKCTKLFKYGHHAESNRPLGGLSHFCVLVPGTPVFSIPNGLSDEVAATANCAVATVAAAMRLALQTHPIQGSSVAVFGAGMLGLTAAAQLDSLGAKNVVVVDPNPKRLAIANGFGATHTIATSEQRNMQVVLEEISEGRGVDIAFDFAGTTHAVESCVQILRIGGLALLAGSVFPSRDIAFSPENLVRRMVSIRGLHNYLPVDLATAIHFLTTAVERYPFHQLVSRTFVLEECEKAFQYAQEHQPVRVAVSPSFSASIR